MKIAVGEKLPNTILSQMTSNGPQATELAKLTVGKRVVLVGMPGAFTKTCTNSHLPSLIRNSSLLFEKGGNKKEDHLVSRTKKGRIWHGRFDTDS